MRIQKITTLAVLAVALAMPGASLAKSDKKAEQSQGHGIGKGGVPDLRDRLLAMIEDLQDQIDTAVERIQGLEVGLGETNARVDALEGEVADLDSRLAAIESQFVDDDGDTFSEVQDDCDDANAAVSPGAAEVAANGIDDDCDHLTDEAA